jgi:hypothetical protein
MTSIEQWLMRSELGFLSRAVFREELMDLVSSVSRRLFVSLVLVLTLGAFAYADDTEGTWQLVMRKLPDGTVQIPPMVQGRVPPRTG